MIHSVKDEATTNKQKPEVQTLGEYKDPTTYDMRYSVLLTNISTYLAKVENKNNLMRIKRLLYFFSVGYMYAKITVLDS